MWCENNLTLIIAPRQPFKIDRIARIVRKANFGEIIRLTIDNSLLDIFVAEHFNEFPPKKKHKYVAIVVENWT